MGTLPTIKVVRDNKRGWQIINQSKYDANPSDYAVYEEGGDDDKLLTRDEIKANLDGLGIEYKGNASRAKLLAQLDLALLQSEVAE